MGSEGSGASEYQMPPTSAVTDDVLLAHLEKVDARVRRLEPMAANLFGLACMERQWRVFERAVAGTEWARLDQPTLRAALDWCWEVAVAPELGGVPHPKSALLESGSTGSSSPLVAAFYIAGTIIDLTTSTARSEPSYARYVANHGIDRIETLVESCEDPGNRYDRLYEVEMARQVRDLDAVPTLRTGEDVDHARVRWCTEDMYDGMWFD